MNRSWFITSLMLVALFLAFGCGGDSDCPSCPADVDTVTVTETVTDTLTETVTDTLTDTLEVPQEFLAWAEAYIRVDPGANFEGYVRAAGGVIPYLDSFTVGDSTGGIIEADYEMYVSDPHYWVHYVEGGTSYMYQSGDTAEVTLWGCNRSSTARVVVLDYAFDYSDMMVPDDGKDTIAYGNEYTCEWTSVENAEWYAIEINYWLDSTNETAYRDFYAYTYDTTYTISDTAFGYPVRQLYFSAVPTTGPDPQSGIGNWEGDFATGKLYSVADYAVAIIYWENPDAAAKLAAPPADEPVRKPAEDIVRAVNEAYR